MKTVVAQGSEIEKILLEKRDLAQLYLIALQTSAYFLYLVNQKYPKEILHTVMNGIKEGLKKVSLFFPEALSSDVNDFLSAQFNISLEALNKEFVSEPDNFISAGKTASMITESIAKDCKFDQLLQSSKTGAIERIMIERIVSTSGIVFLVDVCPKLKITYRS